MAEARDSDQISWGTWEELLLACAVKRHGFLDWNSIAMEVQSRSHLLITARDCELKFLDLKRRYQNENDVALNQIGSRISDKVDIGNVPWIDELRNLRVAELRREVQRYDVSIHSLQLKVKKLEQEREHGFKETEIGTEKPDLTTKSRDIRSENDERIFSDSDRSEPKTNNTKLAVAGEDSDREDLSVNQSNSSGNRKNIAENGKSESKPEFTNSGSFRPEPVGPQSDDGSTETLVKMKKETEVDGESELADSEAEAAANQSDEGGGGGGEETRESSEVQSSASLTGKLKMKMKKKKKKKKRERFLRKEISGGSSGNETRLTEIVKSRRLMEVLQMIRTLKHSSLFESRLQSQETEEYKGIVRQHLDLEIVQAKLNSGSYSSSSLAFYRDLLLLCNNAIIFFPRFSNETMAAHKLRRLVSSEMKKSQQVFPSDPSPEVVDSPPAVPSQPKGPLERSNSLLAKQKSSAPIIVCRKRSSISAKHSSSGFGDKGDRSNDDEKSVIDLKSTVKTALNAVEEIGITKDSKLKEKPVTGARSWRRSGDSLTNSSGPSVKKQSTSAGWKPTSATKTEAPPKEDKKKPDIVTPEKKRSAADFLKRIKQNSPAETIKRNGRGGGGSSSGGNAGGEQKNSGGKGKERAARQNNDKKRPKEDSSPSKRSVGRPPKKMPEPNPVSTKRAREGGGKEPLKRPRKRSRR